jgi:hypothetical protein
MQAVMSSVHVGRASHAAWHAHQSMYGESRLSEGIFHFES